MRTPMLWKSSSLKLVRSGVSSGSAWHLLQRARSLEQHPPWLGGFVDRFSVPSEEAVEWRIERGQSAFIRRERANQVLRVRGTAEHRLKGLLVLGEARERRDGGLEVRLPHLHGIRDGEGRLILEGLRSTVPELRLVVQRVQHRQRVALAAATQYPDGGRPAVGERALGIVASGTGHGSVDRQPAVEEELLSERDLFGRLRIIGRNGCERLVAGQAHLPG